MLITTKNTDFLIFQFNNISSELEIPFKKELDDLIITIKSILTSNKEIKKSVNAKLKLIFNFRIKAIKWLNQTTKLEVNKIIQDVYPQLKELKENPQIDILIENILFAFRCNKRVITALIKKEELTKKNVYDNLNSLPEITYNQFIVAIGLGVPNDEIAQKLLDLTNASLLIEFCAISAAIINDEKMNLPERIINELSFLVADAAQEYLAISYELGILNVNASKQDLTPQKLDNDFINEQKMFANLGIDDYSKALLE